MTRKSTHPLASVDRSAKGSEAWLAKLTRPQLAHAVLRERLFDQLDDARSRPMVWIQGPPGAGKTTLLASWLGTRQIKTIWYQVDRGDADLGAFFEFFSYAVAMQKPRGVHEVSRFAQENFADLEAFTRGYFRKLSPALGNSCVIAFDNYQEVEPGSHFHKVIAWLLAEISPGVNVIMVSRAEPPAEFARHQANQWVARIGWEDLRLTFEEACRIASQNIQLETDQLETLYEKSEGWAAGLVLILEQFRLAGAVNPVVLPESLETVFNYFAGEIFARLDPATRDFLARTSVLPSVNADMATRLTGVSDSAQLLNKLHKSQSFIDRRVADTVSYQYHALFRLFLQEQVREKRFNIDWNTLVDQSAAVLEALGQIEEAILLYIESHNWMAASRLIVTRARMLLSHGRWQTVQQWIEMLPENIRGNSPWLNYWLGMCRLRFEPARARVLYLEPAFEMFERSGDPTGQAVAATAINEAHMVEWEDYRRLDRWIDTLEVLLRRDNIKLEANVELAVRAGLFTAIVLRQTNRKDIPELARQLTDLLRQDLDPNYKLLAARGIFIYNAYSGEFLLTEEVMDYTKAAFDASAATTLNRVWYAARLGFALRYRKDRGEMARHWFKIAREIARKDGLRFLEAPIAIYAVWAEEVFGQTEDLERESEIAETNRNASSRFESAFHQMSQAFLLARRNDFDGAHLRLAETLAFHDRAGYTLGVVASHYGLTVLRLRTQDFVGAAESLSKVVELFFDCTLRNYIERLYRAAIALGLRDPVQARRELSAAFALGSRHGLENALSEHMFHSTTAELCALALEHGIEVAYVRKIVHAQRLFAPSRRIDNWPWPARIRALGAFTLEIRDQPLIFSGKAPKKPLELLKLLASSDKAQVDVAWLCKHLWPEAEGDTLRDVFNVTLSRLRKLLPVEDFLLLNEGKLSLNPELVWSDLWAFEQESQNCLDKIKQRRNPSEIEASGDKLLGLYAGDLLSGDPETPWLLSARDRLRSRLLRTLKALGAFWESQEQWGHARNIYERVLEMDNVAEDAYRRLMECYARSGQFAEALRVYSRCRQLLHAVLGIAPSRETEILHNSIRSKQ